MAIRPRVRTRLPQEAVDDLRAVLDCYDRARGGVTVQTTPTDTLIVTLRNRMEKDPNSLWWTDIAEAELCVIDVLDEAAVRARLGGWRRLREVAGSSRYASYLSTACDLTPGNASLPCLRADLSECLRAVHYFYGAYGVAARSRSDVTKALLCVAGVIILIEAIVAAVFATYPLAADYKIGGATWGDVRAMFEWIIATSAMAVAGSVVSVQRRLQDPNVDVDPFYRYIQTRSDWFGIAFVSPLFAAIFGLLMYMLLASGLVSTAACKFTQDLSISLPIHSNDWAALLVLGFLAGFAEQLVPDALTRIAARALSGVTTSEPMPPPASTSTDTSTQAKTGASDLTMPPALPPHAHTLKSGVPLERTNEAAALGQDASLASEAAAADQQRGVA